jgi:hypothetical protein
MSSSKLKFRNLLIVAILLMPYIFYTAFIIRANQGPVDYETFMTIGHRLLDGKQVYSENSYYPMPFVMIFAFFSSLPRPASMALWLLLPVIIALAIAGWRPYPLVFAPVFSHFTGGQTSVFGLLGLWGYRRNIAPDNIAGGIWLGLTLLKPQLGLVPLAYAIWQWISFFRSQRRVPRQAWAWGVTMLILYLPGFFLVPDWVQQWLQYPRPLFERAMSGFIPRTLLILGLNPQAIPYWLIWGLLGALLLLAVWLVCRRRLPFDALILWSFITSPLVHDYDLIQTVPFLDTPLLQWAAVILSLPGWVVILTAYRNDSAWYAFTIIAVGLLGIWLYQKTKSSKKNPMAEPALGGQ